MSPFCTFEEIDKMIEIPVRFLGQGDLPQHATPLSAGMDLRAHIETPITLKTLERKMIPTGLSIALPKGYEAQVRPRSGLAAKYGITILNAPGTIDADYRGDIGVILVNLSQEPFTIAPQDRIAQLVVAQYATVEWQPVDSLPESERGSGGFGSTGKK
jgi:dUTP pyrophosphatase